ncbi:MAG: hypothetical protein AAGA69_01045 [Pseudomonadota bacterium]
MSSTSSICRSDLCLGAALALTGFRTAIFNRSTEPTFIFTQYFGEDADTAAEAFAWFSLKLGKGSRRRLRLHAPCCGLVTSDELSVLGIFSAICRQSMTETRARLDWLIVPEVQVELTKSAKTITDLFTCHDLDIAPPTRLPKVPDWPKPLEICGGTATPQTRQSGQAAHWQ